MAHVETYPEGVGGENLANQLFIDLVGAANAVLPNIDLFDATHTIPWDENSAVLQPVEKVTIEELMAQFNAMMTGFRTHLELEFQNGRITGAKYAEVYVALTQTAMTSAVQFALGKDQAFWMAAKTQADAITAQNQNEAMRVETMLKRANYALTKLKLSTEDSQFGQSEYQRKDILPAQKQVLIEQGEAQRAQTLDTRADGQARTAVNGVLPGMLGIQKALYAQQITTFKEDVRLKAAKIFSDLWLAQKSVDEGTTPSRFFEPPSAIPAPTPEDPNHLIINPSAYDSIFAAAREIAMADYTEEHGFDPTYPPST